MIEEIEVCNFKVEKCKLIVDSLTDRQKEYVKNIEEYKYKYKKIPSIRKIAKIMGLNSPASVHTIIQILKDRGYDYRTLDYEDE